MCIVRYCQTVCVALEYYCLATAFPCVEHQLHTENLLGKVDVIFLYYGTERLVTLLVNGVYHVNTLFFVLAHVAWPISRGSQLLNEFLQFRVADLLCRQAAGGKEKYCKCEQYLFHHRIFLSIKINTQIVELHK